MTEADDKLQAMGARITALEAALEAARVAAKTSQDQLRDFVVRLDVEHAISIKRLQMKMQEHFELMRMHKEWSTAESQLLEDTRTQLMKLTEVYYHVFPERLPQDVRIIEQLKAAQTKPGRDAEKSD